MDAKGAAACRSSAGGWVVVEQAEARGPQCAAPGLADGGAEHVVEGAYAPGDLVHRLRRKVGETHGGRRRHLYMRSRMLDRCHRFCRSCDF